MSSILKYAVCVETDPGALVASTTKLIGEGFIPSGGVAMVREPANPAKGMPLGVTRFAQALVLPRAVQSNPLIVNGR